MSLREEGEGVGPAKPRPSVLQTSFLDAGVTPLREEGWDTLYRSGDVLTYTSSIYIYIFLMVLFFFSLEPVRLGRRAGRAEGRGHPFVPFTRCEPASPAPFSASF